jgi:type 2 lantibiotic biosynthesis protein LanM
MRIGDRIGELAIPDGNQAGWLGIGMVSDRHWALTPASVDLYDGSAGISLFLAYLAVVSSQSRYRHLARQGIESVNEKAAKLCKIDTIQNPGAFGNIGGTIYALTHVGMLWNDNSLIDQATLTALDARRHVEAATNIELLGGISGFATVLTGLLSVAPNNELFDLAKFCADKIVDSLALDVFPSLSWPSSIPSHAPLTGLSHGAAGIALSLSRLAKYLNDPRYMVASQRLVDYEQSVFSERYGNWPDFRCFAPTCVPLQVDQLKTWNSFYTTWCHGAPGIGLSRLSMVADGHGTVGIEADINAAIAQTIAHGFGLNHSLCHGDLGNLELLIMAGDRVPKAQYTKWLSMIVASIRDQGWLTGVPLGTETPGLMTGISGIGYGLLRQIAPATVPSVLTLEPPFSTDRRPQSHGYQH